MLYAPAIGLDTGHGALSPRGFPRTPRIPRRTCRPGSLNFSPWPVKPIHTAYRRRLSISSASATPGGRSWHPYPGGPVSLSPTVPITLTRPPSDTAVIPIAPANGAMECASHFRSASYINRSPATYLASRSGQALRSPVRVMMARPILRNAPSPRHSERSEESPTGRGPICSPDTPYTASPGLGTIGQFFLAILSALLVR